MSTAESDLRAFRRGRFALAERVACDIPDGYWVNLGIGMPTLIADVVIPDREVVFQCENGLIGVGPRAHGAGIDPDQINADKEPVTIIAGGSFMHHADSFAMIRGGHLDLAVLGAFQVSPNGDLANWKTPGEGVPAVGGAMDLAVGARAIWVMMSLCTNDGRPKLVPSCDFPLTAKGVVSRIFTDLAVFSIEGGEMIVDEIVPGLSFGGLEALTQVPLRRR